MKLWMITKKNLAKKICNNGMGFGFMSLIVITTKGKYMCASILNSLLN